MTASVRGDNWLTTLITKIQSESCATFLLFSSRAAVNSPYVNEEVETALEAHKKIVNVRMDEAIFNYRTEVQLRDLQNLFINDPAFEDKLLYGIDESTFMIR